MARTKLTREERMLLLQKNNKSIIQAKVEPYQVCPTAIPELNALLPGGFVKGKVCLLYGSPSAGKSTTSVGVIALEMKKDKDHICLLVPSERGDDLAYYSKLGMDMNRTQVMMKEEYILEDVLEEIRLALKDGLVDSVLIDSWDMLMGFKEMYDPKGVEKDVTKDTVMVKAAGSSKMWKRLKSHIADNKTLFLIVCQLRTKMGMYGASEKFSGGFALEHSIDIGVKMSFVGLHKTKVEGRDEIDGQNVRISLDKSKVNGNAYKSVEVTFIRNKGWDKVTGLWNVAVASNLIAKTGGWYSYRGFPMNKAGDHKLQGEAKAKGFFDTESEFKILTQMVDFIQANENCTEETLAAKLEAIYVKKESSIESKK